MPDPYPGPNEEVLEAQRRVCTGPHQSRPLGKKEGDPDPGRILDLILASLKGDLPRAEQASQPKWVRFSRRCPFVAPSGRRLVGARPRLRRLTAMGTRSARCLRICASCWGWHLISLVAACGRSAGG